MTEREKHEKNAGEWMVASQHWRGQFDVDEHCRLEQGRELRKTH
jgi:hypothetical protein